MSVKPSPSVRRLVRTAYGKTKEQRAIVEACIDTALELGKKAKPTNGSGSPSAVSSATAALSGVAGAASLMGGSASAAAGPAASSSSASRIYSEITTREEYQATMVPSMGSLGGVAVSVSDALDVVGFRTRFGMSSTLLHRAPTEESAFINWIRRRGAHVVGKLKCHSPLAWEESTVLSKHNPAYLSVQRGASHYAITTTVLGAPAMSAPYYHDMIGFKPTAMSFDARQQADAEHPILNTRGSASIGLVARSVDDVKYLWDVYTGAIQSQNVVQSIKEAERREEAARMHREKQHEGILDMVLGEEHDAFLDRMVRVHSQEPPLALTVGFPTEWIATYFADVHHNAAAFEQQLREAIHKSLSGLDRKYRNVKVQVMPLPFLGVDVEAAVKAHKVIAEYELARSVMQHTAGGPAAGAGGSPSTPSAPSSPAASPGVTPSTAATGGDSGRRGGGGGGGLRSGMMDELPQEIVTAIYNGRNVTEAQYDAARRCRDDVVREIDNQFRDVDLICCPIVGEPYVDGNIRTFISTIPFALAGNPMVSVRVNDSMSLQLIGEMGRDTGLLEDATSFLRFMGKGRAPRWWRKKFLGEED